MSENRPYLTLENRADYLVDRGYMEKGELSADAKAFLGRTNFHYFLGYARNFRKLRREGRVEGNDRIDRVIELVMIDHEVSTRLFGALRTLEWRLRASLVDHHCAMYPSKSYFLDPGHYRVMDSDATPIQLVLLDQIARTREPYVLGTFQAYEAQNHRPWLGSPAKMQESDRLVAMRQLPIWAVVDGWSLGVLERVLTETAPTGAEQDKWLWKEVASSFGISNQLFQTQLSSLIVLRNLVAHHSRLWMRPTAVTPKAPKLYAKYSRNVDAKAMYIAWLTLASFLNAGGGDRELLNDLDALIARDSLYELGVKRPLQSAD